MKSATCGIDTFMFRIMPIDPPPPSRRHSLGLMCVDYMARAEQAYRKARQNGEACDTPVGTCFPGDGDYSWHTNGSATLNGQYYVKYTEGPRDRDWMVLCDRNYLARLDRETQAVARKQACEAQHHEAQEKLKHEQQLKEKPEEQLKHAQQLKTLEAARSEVEAARLDALQGNADAQFQLGQRYAGGLDVKLDKKEALKWFQKAAAQGHAPAQFALLALDRACEKGEETRQSSSSAQKGHAKVVTQHVSHAEEKLARVKQRIVRSKKSSSHHLPTTASTQNSTSHSGGSEQESVDSPNHVELPEAQSVNTDLNYPLHTHQAGSSSAGTGGNLPDLSSPRSNLAATPIAEVLYPFTGELTLSAGERVCVVDRVTPDWWRCEHDGQAGLVPSHYLRTLSSAHVPSASPVGYTSYTTPTSGEAIKTAGIFTTSTPSSAENNHAAENKSYQTTSRQ
jgi:Sel1 repeat/Variant SH3 domain